MLWILTTNSMNKITELNKLHMEVITNGSNTVQNNLLLWKNKKQNKTKNINQKE